MSANEAGTILIVDDNLRNLRLLSDVLNDSGFDVAVATNGTRGLEIAKEGAPDLVLLDVKMEGIDGFETCRRLKADPSTNAIPVIFMTASTELSTDKVKGLTLGAVDFLTKPFSNEELIARVQVHTKLSKMTRYLAAQVDERVAAERALHELTQELESRVEQRTIELEKALKELTHARTQLETEVARQTEELRRANDRLAQELRERELAEKARAGLQEEVIRAQQARLAELSTPLIPITDRIMVMPLIGTIDAGRAEQTLEAALNGAQANRAHVVIIDVTGVTTIDGAIASTLMKAAASLRLIGAKAVITGIRAELAQTLVALDIDLSSVVTKGTLRGGIDYALTQTGNEALKR